MITAEKRFKKLRTLLVLIEEKSTDAAETMAKSCKRVVFINVFLKDNFLVVKNNPEIKKAME